MAFFENYTNNQTNASQLGSVLDGVETRINSVQDQLSNLGNSAQMTPLINDLRSIVDYMNQLKQSTGPELTEGFLKFKTGVESLLNTMNNSNVSGLTNIKDTVSDIHKTLQEINSLSSLNQLSDSVDKLTLSLDTVAVKGNTFREIINNIDPSNMSNDLQETLVTIDNFMNTVPGKFQNLKDSIQQSIVINPDDMTGSVENAVEEMKMQMNGFASYINENLKIGESLVNQLDSGDEAVGRLKESVESMVASLKDGLQSVSFNEQNQQIEYLIDNIGRINETSFDGLNQNLNLAGDVVNILSENFSRMFTNIESNNKSIVSLSDLIKDLNNGNTNINFNTNISEISKEAEKARDIIQGLNQSGSGVNPDLAIEQFQKIKDANEEMKKIKEQIAGVSLNSGSGMALNQLMEQAGADGGIYSSELQNNDILINSAQKLQDALSQYGDTYKSVVDSLSNQVTELEGERQRLAQLGNSEKNSAFKGLREVLNNPDDEYSQMVNFQLLGNKNSISSRSNINFLTNGINNVGNDAIKVENSVRKYKRVAESEYSGFDSADYKNVDKAFKGSSLDQVVDQSQDLQRLVYEFNKNKEAMIGNVKKAVATGAKKDIENAKADMQALLDFSEDLLSQTKILGDAITVKSLKQFETLPDQVKDIIGNVQNLISHTREMAYDTTDLAEAFGLSTNEVRKLNKELDSTQYKIQNTMSSSEKMLSVLSGGWKSLSGVLGSVSKVAAMIGIPGLTLASLVSDTAGYYKDRGMMSAESYQADISLGDATFNADKAYDRNYTKALQYHSASNGLIDFDEYNNSYLGLSRNVGGQVGKSGQDTIEDLTSINEDTFALSKVYGISDSTIQQATKVFYQDFGMSAKETSNAINEMVQSARSANVPIEKYVSQMSSLASNYRDIGLSGKDAQNIMNNMILSGMNVDMAFDFSQSAGNAVSTFSKNKSLNAYFGVLSGEYSDPFSAIVGAQDKYDEKGAVRPEYLDKMTSVMDSALNQYSILAPEGSSQQKYIVQETLKNQFGFDDKAADIGVDAYLSGGKAGFTKWFEDYEKNENSENILKVEGQDELIQKIEGMSNELAETQKIQALAKEQAYQLTTVAEALGDQYLAPLREGIETLTSSINNLISSLAGGISEHGSTIGGLAMAGGAAYLGTKAYKGIKNVSEMFGIGTGASAARHVDDIADIATDGSRIAGVASDASKIPWSKLAKGGLAALGIAGAYSFGKNLFSGNANEGDYDTALKNGYVDPQMLYGSYDTAPQNSYVDPQTLYGSYDTNANTRSQYQAYSNYNIGSGKESTLLSLANGAAIIGGDAIGSAALSKTLTSTLGKSTLGNVLGYGVGDVIYGAGTLAQHGIQGDYVSGDVQKSLADIIMGGGGSVLGAGIGSIFGPVGTLVGGAVGGFGTTLLDLIKLDSGKGLGTTMTDSVSVALGGSTSEELEYKRAIINNPDELLKHRNELLGISEEQSEEIDDTMKDHSKELEHLTEEQKTAMKVLCSQLMDTGETIDQAFKDVSTLFSKENVESTMNQLSDSIKSAIENAKLPKGWSEEDVQTVSNNGKEAREKAQSEYLNSADYISNILSKNNVSYSKVQDLKLLGESGWKSAYNNANDENHDIAVSLMDEWMDKDLDKSEKKATTQSTKDIEKRNKAEKQAEIQAQIDKDQKIQETVNSEIYGDNNDLLKNYISKLIKDSKTSLSNLKKSGKGEGDWEYDDTSDKLTGYQNYLDYLDEVDKQTTIAKKNFANGNNKVKTKNIFGFSKEKEYKNEDDYVEAYLNSLNLEAKGLLNTSLYGDSIKSEARDYVVDSIKKGSNSDVYKNNPQIQKLIEDQNKSSEESKLKAEKSIDIQDNTLSNILIGNTTSSNIFKSLTGTNESLENLINAVNNMGTKITTSSGSNVFTYKGTNNGELAENVFQTAQIDTAANVKNYSGTNDMSRTKDIAKINELFAGTKLEGTGETYVTAAQKYGVDPMLLASISYHETGGDSNLLNNYNNVGGIKGTSKGAATQTDSGFAAYNSLNDGISDLARIMKEVYYASGRTSISEIQEMYAPLSDGAINQNWLGGVAGTYSRLNTSTKNYLASADNNIQLQQQSGSNTADTPDQDIPQNTNTYTIGSAIADIAMAQEGAPYLWGAEGSVDWDGDGDTRAGYDCSGLVSYAAHMAGAGVGRLTASGLYEKCLKISESQLQKGDLGFIKNGTEISHVGVYCGDGKWVHAPQPGENVKIVSNAGFNAYGRLPGSNGLSSDIDISQFAFSGSGNTAPGSALQTAYDSVMSADLFSSGSMLYGIVPSDYSSNFTNDSTQRTNYAQLVTDAFSQSGGNGLANTIYSQNRSRMDRLNWETASGYSQSNMYSDVINSVGKDTKSNKKDYNINVKLDSNTGDSKLEKQINTILQDALKKIENLGVSVSSLEDSIGLLDQSLYSVRGG